MSEWTTVCKTDELKPGEWKVVLLDDINVAVYNLNGEFYAIEDTCSHDFACLAGMPIEGDEVICPRHGARFNIKTGDALTPPAYEPVAVFPVQIEGELIQIRDSRWD